MTPFLARIKTVCQLNSEWNVAEKIQSPSSIHFLSPSLFQLADHSTRRERERETSRVIVETNNSSRIHSIAHWPNRSQFHHFFRKANESSKKFLDDRFKYTTHKSSSDIIIITFDQRYRIRRKLIVHNPRSTMDDRYRWSRDWTCFRVKRVPPLWIRRSDKISAL